MSRGKRHPTGEELALWEQVTETIAPLKRAKPVRKPKTPEAVPAKPSKTATTKAAAIPVPPKKPLQPAPPPSLNPFDRRTLGRIGRGTVAIDARIDLHGMTQAAAQGRLVRFLSEAQARGAKLVLVITGKGRSGGTEAGARGILRRVVPMWLSAAKLRPLVIGFDEAGPAHGGAGALYVRIRRAGRG